MSHSETDVLELKALPPEELNAPPPEDLLKLVKKEKQVPAAINIVATPSNIIEFDEKEDMNLLVTFISLYSTILVHKTMPAWELNGKDILTFINAKANSFAKIIEGPFMSAILHRQSNVKVVDRYFQFEFTPFHTEFLKTFFQGFPQSVIDQLEVIFTSIQNRLNKHNVNWTRLNRDVNSFICYYFSESGILKLRTFYVHFKNISGGSGKVGFYMDYDDFNYTIDADQMAKNRKYISDSINRWTKDARNEIEDLSVPEKVNIQIV